MSNLPEPSADIPIACNPEAIPAAEREHWIEVGKQVYAAVEQAQEIPGGYRFRLPADTVMLHKLAEYMSNERLCCAFLRFTLELEPGGGPFSLSLTGAAGVKEYLGTVLAENDLLDEQVARAAGLK